MYYDSSYSGMHFFWWVFWVILFVSFFSLLTPVPRKHWQRISNKPLDILMRRLANGDITEAEYEGLKSLIHRDSKQNIENAKTWQKTSASPLNT